MTAKLWREFVSPDPDAAEVQRIAARFAESRYDIKVALRELLLCDAFYAAENRGVLVKSPTELVVGTLRSFGIEPEQALAFAIATAVMGQNLMSPPNVKGWPGGEAWINTTTLLARKQFVDRVDPRRRRDAPASMADDVHALGHSRDAALERGLSSLRFRQRSLPRASSRAHRRMSAHSGRSACCCRLHRRSTDEPPSDADRHRARLGARHRVSAQVK